MDKEIFDGAKEYLKSAFRAGITGQEMQEKQMFLGVILSNWAIGDIIKLFYETLIWSIKAIDKDPINHSRVWRAGFAVDAEIPSLWIKFKHEEEVQVHPLNEIYKAEDLFLGEELAKKRGHELEFSVLRWSSDIAPYFEFYFCDNLYFKHQPYLSFETICDYGWSEDADGYEFTSVDALYRTQFFKNTVTHMYDKDPDSPIPPAYKVLFKGKKYFLLAVRHLFKSFTPDRIPSIGRIKKFMLKNNLPNPFQTFWV